MKHPCSSLQWYLHNDIFEWTWVKHPCSSLQRYLHNDIFEWTWVKHPCSSLQRYLHNDIFKWLWVKHPCSSLQRYLHNDIFKWTWVKHPCSSLQRYLNNDIFQVNMGETPMLKLATVSTQRYFSSEHGWNTHVKAYSNIYTTIFFKWTWVNHPCPLEKYRWVETAVSFCIPYPKIRHWNRYNLLLYCLCLMFGIGMTPLVYDLSVWNSMYSV